MSQLIQYQNVFEVIFLIPKLFESLNQKFRKSFESTYHSWEFSTNADIGETCTVYVSLAEYSNKP